jgi:hypothetical protein
MSQSKDGIEQEGQAQEPLQSVSYPPIGEEEVVEPKVEEEDRLAALERKIEEQQAQFAEERRTWQHSIDRLLQQRQERQEPHQPAGPSVDFSGLPDPVEKPEEFQKTLQQRVGSALQNQQKQLQEYWQQTSQKQFSEKEHLDRLWNKFQTEHSDLADKNALLQGTIATYKGELSQRGLDIQQEIYQNPDNFINEVARRMRAELGTPAPAPVNRTGGLGGGTSYNGGGKGQDKKYPGFMEQLKKAQLDSGLV